jgi:hypothetical protein
VSTLKLTKFAGLVTAPGLLERAEASFVECINWEFPAPGVMRKRRGNKKLAGNTGGPVWKLLTSRLMGSSLLAHIGVGTSGTSLRFGDGTGALTALGTVDGNSLTRARDTRMQMALSGRNHYVTATEGVARVESDFLAGSNARYAGMPRGLGPNTWTLVAGTNLGNGFARAYRVTWHRKDADGVELGGAPTSRFVVANAVYNAGYTGATRQVNLEVQIPKEFGTLNTNLTTSYYWRLWANRGYLEASEVGDDEMHLLAEAYLTAADIVNGFFTYVDSTPDTFLMSSPTLHTNQFNFPLAEAGIRQGVLNEDAPPPLANDVCEWNDVLWYGDCQTRPSITAELIAALADGDTVTVTCNGVATVVTARNAPALASEFLIVNTAATTALNLRQTVTHMVRALNQTGAANGFSAHQVATTSTHPGLFFLEMVRWSATTLVFNTSVIAKFTGLNGYAIPSNVTALSQSNLLWFSKPFRGDAVPPTNGLRVGPADNQVLRMFPFGERLLVFTTYGIYQVLGRTFADFAVFPFDLGYRLMGRELVALCDEKIYAWCNEGIVEIDDGGVRVVSAPIEPTIEAALVAAGGNSLSTGRTVFAALGFATGYRNQHQVRFHYPEANDSANLNGCAYWLSFDTRTRCWARGKFSEKAFFGYWDNRSCAVVRMSDDLLAFGNWSNGGDTRLFLERRDYTATDFIDNDMGGATDNPVKSTARLQYQVPDVRGAVHWQQTVLNWDAEELTWRPLPMSIDVQHVTEEMTPASAQFLVTELVTRIEPPIDARRGQRLQVLLVHEIAQYAGIVGIEQDFRAGTRFARKVAP